MSVYFAAARSAAASPVARVLAKRTPNGAANDGASPDPASTATLRAALLHFAAHGLGAAQAAHREAERAFADKDEAAGQRWLTICRTLDPRLAATIGAARV